MSGLVSIDAPGIRIEDVDHLQYLQRQVAQLLDRRPGFPGSQPVSFSRKHLKELSVQDYYVCEKSDGMRYLLYLTHEDPPQGEDKPIEVQYLIDRKNNYWFMPKTTHYLHFPIPKEKELFHMNTIIDGELVIDRLPNGKMQATYLVFDCLVLDGNSLMQKPLDKRLGYFKQQIFDPYKKLLNEFPEEVPFQHFLAELKGMEFSYAIDKMFRITLPSLHHGNDGLIFTCRTTTYKHGTDEHILKWKPENENSVDFRLSLDIPFNQPDEVDIAEGITQPYPDYDALPVFNLLVGGSAQQGDSWFATMFVDPDQWEDLKSLQEPLHERIVECYMDENKRWRYMRFRDDKDKPNHISTVNSVIESITDRVTKDDLLGASEAIRDAWKKRNSPPVPAKRKSEEQGNARPSPGPPVKRE